MYHLGTRKHKALIHRKRNVIEGKRPCWLYFHGGGAVGGDCTQMIPPCNRVAMETDCTVINCNYGLAPEVPAPGGIEDAYACLKDIHANADKYNIDKHRICIYGESGGAYIVAGVSLMLAERDESHIVKFQYQQIPMVENIWNGEHELQNEIEEACKGFQEGVYNNLDQDCEKRYFVEPNLAPEELLAKCPPTLILTSEFDMYRRLAERAAEKFERAGKLLELGILKGVHHGSSGIFDQKRTDTWYNVHYRAT